MKNFQLLPLFFGIATFGAGAQPGAGRNSVPNSGAPEHRRAELRLVLKEPRGRETPDKEQIFENVAYDRHLTPQERADLRRQLRQLRQDAKPVSP